MARLDYPDPEAQSPEIRDRLVRLGSLNVTRMMSHAEPLMVAYSRLGAEMLLRGSLDPVLREAVILRIGQLCRSDYEWHQHVSVARAVGMDEPMLEAIERGDYAALPERERTAIALAEEIHGDNGASEETFLRASRLFPPQQLVELCLLAGYYIMTAGFLKSFAIEIEETPPLGASMPPRIVP